MREKPILYTPANVALIREGMKTQTRRKTIPGLTEPLIELRTHSGEHTGLWGAHHGIDWENESIKCPYGIPGFYQWIRETWRPRSWGEDFDWMVVEYKSGGSLKELNPWETWGENRAEDVWENLGLEMERNGCYITGGGHWVVPDDGTPINWRPSIFMPKDACRYRTLIKDIRMEKLQDISEADAIAEGMDPDDPIGHYQAVWDSINKKQGFGWEIPQVVWVIEFHLTTSRNRY